MDCLAVSKRLSAYLDGEVSHGEESQIRQHLDACPKCRDDAKALSRIYDMLLEELPVPQPALLTFGKPEILREKAVAQIQHGKWLRLLIAACVIGILFGGGFGLLISPRGGQLFPSPGLPKETRIVRAWGMDALEELPPGSLEGVYMTLANAQKFAAGADGRNRKGSR
jgi:anti-sigma factor RsiW